MWLNQHRKIGGYTLVVVLLAAVAYVFLVRPLRREVVRMRGEAGDLHAALSKKNWPMKSERLDSLYQTLEKDVARFSRRSEDVMREATSVYLPRIRELYGDADSFRTRVSLLEYRDEYDQTIKALTDRGVRLAEEVLGMGENTERYDTYQQILQLWTMEEMVNTALGVGLDVVEESVPVESEEGELRVRSALVTVLPVQAYVVDESDTEAYLLEFPVQMVLRGRLPQVVRFLKAVHEPGRKRFFPVSHLEIRQVVPNVRGEIEDMVEVRVVCSSFFRHSEKLPSMRRDTSGKAPQGA